MVGASKDENRTSVDDCHHLVRGLSSYVLTTVTCRTGPHGGRLLSSPEIYVDRDDDPDDHAGMKLLPETVALPVRRRLLRGNRPIREAGDLLDRGLGRELADHEY